MNDFVLPVDDLSIETFATDANAWMINPGEGMSHWHCVLTRDGASVDFPISLSNDQFGDRSPTLEEAVGFLVADVTSVLKVTSAEEWLRQAGLEMPADEALQEQINYTFSSLLDVAQHLSMSFGSDWLLSVQAAIDPSITSPSITM